MEKGSSEQPLRKVGSYTLDPSLPGSLEYHRASKEGLLASQPPSSQAWQGLAQGLYIMKPKPFLEIFCRWRRGICGRETLWSCLCLCDSRYFTTSSLLWVLVCLCLFFFFPFMISFLPACSHSDLKCFSLSLFSVFFLKIRQLRD